MLIGFLTGYYKLIEHLRKHLENGSYLFCNEDEILRCPGHFCPTTTEIKSLSPLQILKFLKETWRRYCRVELIS